MTTPDELLGRHRDLLTRKVELQRQSTRLTASLASLAQDAAAVRANSTRLEQSHALLQAIIERMSADHFKRLERFIAYALRLLYPARNYGFEIAVEEARGASTAEFYLLETRPDGTVLRSSLQGYTGGSIRTVVGFIVQIFHLDHFKAAPILFLDEALGALEEEAIPPLVELMEQLAEKKGYVFVLVTHDPRIVPYAKRVWTINQGRVQETTHA